jgi:colanic acid/amylovoran biosynthesis glycosyltransferase
VTLRVAHVVKAYLPLSQTFIHTQLEAQRDLTQMVVTRRRVDGATFPSGRVWELDRLSRRLDSRLPGARIFGRRAVHPLRRFEPDVLHAHFGWMGHDALVASRALRVPLVVAVHGRDVYAPLYRPGSAREAYGDIFRSGATFTCVGPRAARELADAGCPQDRLHIVPVGIDLERFPFSPAPAVEPVVFLQVARLTPKKGVDVTLRAFSAARASLDAELWIVGDGPQRDELHGLARDLGIAARVRFHGALAPSEVSALMARAHVGVQASRVAADGDREGSPTVLIEMQARGVDVVATRHADIPFIVAHPDELVDEGDVEGLAAALVEAAGRALVERQHDATSIRSTLRHVYETAIRDR